MRRRSTTHWSALRQEVESALAECDDIPPSVRVDGRLRRLEGGSTHESFKFWVKADAPLPAFAETALVLHRLPIEDFAFLSKHDDSRAHVRSELDGVWDECLDDELLLMLRWLAVTLRAEREGTQEGHGPEAYRALLERLLQRAAGLSAE